MTANGTRAKDGPANPAGALRIDPREQTPLYLQVRKALLKAIKSGVFQAEDALP